MADRVFVNVPAQACGHAGDGRFGFVRYCGMEYAIIGVYFVPDGLGRIDRKLFYILRASEGDGRIGLRFHG